MHLNWASGQHFLKTVVMRSVSDLWSLTALKTARAQQKAPLFSFKSCGASPEPTKRIREQINHSSNSAAFVLVSLIAGTRMVDAQN